MGSDQSVSEYPEQQRLAHPKFKKIKFINDNQVLQTRIPVESEEEVRVWHERLKGMVDCEEEYLLLPRCYTYSKKAVCGTAGTVDVLSYPQVD